MILQFAHFKANNNYAHPGIQCVYVYTCMYLHIYIYIYIYIYIFILLC